MGTTEFEGDANPPSLTKIVRDLKAAIARANDRAQASGPRVSKVDLELAVIRTRAVGGEIEWKVPIIGLAFKGGTKLTQQQTTTIKMSLVPPESPAVQTDSFVEDLVRAVQDLRLAISEARLADPKPLEFASGSVEVVFGVDAEGNLSLVAVAELEQSVTQKAKLSFGDIEPAA